MGYETIGGRRIEAANNTLSTNYENIVEEFSDMLSEEQARTRILISDLETLHEQYQTELAQDNR